MMNFKQYLLENDNDNDNVVNHFVKITENKAFKIKLTLNDVWEYKLLIKIKINFKGREYVFPCRGELNVIFKIKDPANFIIKYVESNINEWNNVDLIDIDLKEFQILKVTKIMNNDEIYYKFNEDDIKYDQKDHDYILSLCAYEYVNRIMEIYSTFKNPDLLTIDYTEKYKDGSFSLVDKIRACIRTKIFALYHIALINSK